MSYKSEKERVAAQKAAKEAPTPVPTPVQTPVPTPVPTPVKSTAEAEIERLKKEYEGLKKKSEEAVKAANAEVERLKKELNEKRSIVTGKPAEPEKAPKAEPAKMVAPTGYAAKTRALLDCMYATCRQFEQEVAEMETLERILSASEDELGDALHVWKYRDRNGVLAFARTMGEVLKNSPGGKPEETWAFCVRGEFLELTREQKEMFGLT